MASKHEETILDIKDEISHKNARATVHMSQTTIWGVLKEEH